MKLIPLYFLALVWSHGQARGIGAGFDRTADSLNDDIEQDANIAVQNDAEATVEVEEAEEEVWKPTPEEEIEKAKRLIPILMRLQKKYPTLGKDEQVKVLRQSSGYKEDFKEALDKLEASPEISHDLDIPYLRHILGVARVRKPKKESYSSYGESPVETNIIPKEGEAGGLAEEYQESVEELSEGDFNSDIVMEGDSVEELSEADLNRDIVVEGLFAADFDPNSKIAKEGLFAEDFIDPNSDIVTVGLFAGNTTDVDEDENLEGFPFARAASFMPFSHEERLPIIPPPSPLSAPMDPFPPTSGPLLDTFDPLDAFHEVEINLNFAAPFPTPKRKPSYPRRTHYPRQPIRYLPPPTRSFPYPPPVARPLHILPLQPQFPATYHQPLHSSLQPQFPPTYHQHLQSSHHRIPPTYHQPLHSSHHHIPPTYHQPLHSSHHHIPPTYHQPLHSSSHLPLTPTYHRPLQSTGHHVHRRSTAPPQTYPSTAPPHHYPSTAPPHHYPSTAPPHHYPSTAPPHPHPSTAPPHHYPSTAPPHHYPSTAPPQTYPSTAPPHHYPSTAPPHHYPSTAPPHHYPSHQMYQPRPTHYPSQHQRYHPSWDTSYQRASRHQPVRYGEYNPYVFDYQTSASLDDPNLTAHYPSDYYGYSMQPLPSMRPSNPFSSMQSPGLSLNPHYQYSRAAYNNFLHESMDGQDPVKYVQGLTGA